MKKTFLIIMALFLFSSEAFAVRIKERLGAEPEQVGEDTEQQ